MINSLKIEQFGGIKDLDVEFKEGLNVILGPNEAGKSTVIGALYALLFVDSKLNNKKKESKNFAERAIPYGNKESDYAEGELSFEFEGSNYTIHKLWHSTKNDFVMLKDGKKILNQYEIESILKRYLIYGEGTYSNIIFSKQDDFKQVFQEIKEDSESINNIGQLLKKASMELDGLSIEAFKERLTKEFNILTSNWDMDKGRPIKNKMWDDPHKRNVGEILEHFYILDKARYDINFAIKLEDNIENIKKELLGKKVLLDVENKKLKDEGEIEAEVIKSAALEKDLLKLDKDQKELLEVNKEWPVIIANINNINTILCNINDKKNQLESKLIYSKAFVILQKDLELLEKRKQIEIQMEKLNLEIAKYSKFNKKDIDKIIELEALIKEAEIKLKSAELVGLVLETTKGIKVTDIYGKEEVLEKGDTWQSDAYMKIEVQDNLSIEIKSNQISLEQVKADLEQCIKERESLLLKIGVKTILDAQLGYDRLKEYESDKKILNSKLKELPEDCKKQEIELKKKELESFEIGNVESIEKELKENQEELNKQQIEKAKNENKIESFEKKFKSHDDLISELGKILFNKEKISLELANLKTLPAKYDSVESYLLELKSTREKKEILFSEIKKLEYEVQNLVQDLPERGINELNEIIHEENRIIEGKIKKANQIDLIFKKLDEAIEELENGAISPLEKEFSYNLKFITEDKYKNINFSEEMDISIGSEEKQLPTKLLSSGTLDSVSLAFRLAFIDELMDVSGKLTVLDDCLVNMDEDRQLRSIEMIQNHAIKHQVIFVTCNIKIAEKLGGNIIRL